MYVVDVSVSVAQALACHCAPCLQTKMATNITNVELQHLLHRDYFALVLGMMEACVPGEQGHAKIRSVLFG